MSTINITINIPLLLLFKLGLWRKDQISEKNIFKIKSPGQSRPGQKTFLFLPETVYSLEILKLNFLLRRAVINLIHYWNFLSWLQFLLEKNLLDSLIGKYIIYYSEINEAESCWQIDISLFRSCIFTLLEKRR